MTANGVKPGTRCECRDRTHQYDATRPYARHNAGTCPNRAVRMVAVRLGTSLDGTPMNGRIALCAACAEWHEKGAVR